MLVKTNDEEARPDGAAGGFLDISAVSVNSGRSMDQISAGRRPRAARHLKSGASAPETLEALIRAYPAVQLATLVQAPPEGKEWLHEIKFDGCCLLGYLFQGHVRMRTRNGLDWTSKLRAIADAVGNAESWERGRRHGSGGPE